MRVLEFSGLVLLLIMVLTAGAVVWTAPSFIGLVLLFLSVVAAVITAGVILWTKH